MLNDILASLSELSDAELVARVKNFAGRERDAMAHLVAHLAELDTRDVHLRAGYGSLFAYCRDALGLSEHEAYNRIEAARAARRLPVILEMLAEGSVNLTTVRLLASHLTSGNHRGVLESARGKRKSEVEEIVARLSPRPDVLPSLRKLPAAKPLPLAAPVDAGAPVPAALPSIPSSPPTRSAATTPLSPNRYKVQFTIGGKTLEKLRLAKDLLRHAIPSGDEAAILDRALTALLADLREGSSPPPSSHALRAGRHRDPATSRPRSSARYGGATSGAARSWGRTTAAAASGGFWSSTTSSRTQRAARPPSRTCSYAVGVTTSMRRESTLCRMAVARSCERRPCLAAFGHSTLRLWPLVPEGVHRFAPERPSAEHRLR